MSKKVWTKDIIDCLKDLSEVYTDKKIADILNERFDAKFTMVAVRRKRNKLQLKKFGGTKIGIKNQTPNDILPTTTETE